MLLCNKTRPDLDTVTGRGGGGGRGRNHFSRLIWFHFWCNNDTITYYCSKWTRNTLYPFLQRKVFHFPSALNAHLIALTSILVLLKRWHSSYWMDVPFLGPLHCICQSIRSMCVKCYGNPWWLWFRLVSKWWHLQMTLQCCTGCFSLGVGRERCLLISSYSQQSFYFFFINQVNIPSSITMYWHSDFFHYSSTWHQNSSSYWNCNAVVIEKRKYSVLSIKWRYILTYLSNVLKNSLISKIKVWYTCACSLTWMNLPSFIKPL